MEWLGLLISFGFVFGVLGLAQLLLQRDIVSGAVSRKIVHISVAHWWFLAMFFFEHWQFAIVGPIAFIVLNYLSYRKRLFPAMEATNGRNLGTVYFPISLLLLVIASWIGPIARWVAGMGILTLGYGDGLAALLGENVASSHLTVLGSEKSALGTLAMFVASTAVIALFVLGYGSPAGAVPAVVVTALFATLIEFLTPWGVDNLTVPLLTVGFYYLVFL